MNKFLITLILSLICQNSWAAASFIAGTCAGSGNANNVTTAGINTVGASLIVISLSNYSIAGTSTPTDSQSNTWTKLTSQSTSSGSQQTLYYSINPTTNASQTFTENAGVTNFPSLCVAAFSGISSFDLQNGNFTNSGTTLTTGSVSPSVNNELIVTGVTLDAGGTLSINGGFSLSGTQVSYSGGAHYGSNIAYLIQTSAASANPTWTSSGSATDISAAIATFKTPTVASPGSAFISNATINGMIRE